MKFRNNKKKYDICNCCKTKLFNKQKKSRYCENCQRFIRAVHVFHYRKYHKLKDHMKDMSDKYGFSMIEDDRCFTIEWYNKYG